jgi:hypothetical protein
MLPVAMVLVLLGELLALLAGITPYPHEILLSLPSLGWSLFAFALGGSFLVHLSARPARTETLSALALGLLCMAANGPTLALVATRPVSASGAAMGSLGLGSLGVLALRAAWRSAGAGRTLAGALVVPALVLPTYVYLWIVARLNPITDDAFAYAFDAALAPAQPSFVVTRLLRASPTLSVASALAYGALPLTLGALLALERARGGVQPPRVLRAVLFAGVAGFALYNVLPMAGPAQAFGAAFPTRPPEVGSEVPLGPMRLPIAMRNAMPSLHAAWSLLLCWGSRGHGRAVGLATLALLALTLLSALGTGEHYLVDFVVALPLALAAHAAALPPSAGGARRRAMLLAGTLTLAWLGFLRFGWPLYVARPAVAWPLATATVALCLMLERGLRHDGAAAVPSPAVTRKGSP